MKVVIGILGDECNVRGAQALYDGLLHYCPWGSSLYEDVRGSPLTPHHVYSRWYHMYYYKTLSEHYLENSALADIAPAVRRYVRAKREISMREAVKLGTT